MKAVTLRRDCEEEERKISAAAEASCRVSKILAFKQGMPLLIAPITASIPSKGQEEPPKVWVDGSQPFMEL